MKNAIKACSLLLATVLVSGTAGANEIRFINADDSALGDICIAAVESSKTVSFLLQELGMSPSEAKAIRCNGQSLRSFTRRYRQDDDYPVYIFNVGDASPETKLCIAAISSEFMVEEVKAEFFSDSDAIEEEIRCNGLTLKQFVGKYKSHMSRRRVTMK